MIYIVHILIISILIMLAHILKKPKFFILSSFLYCLFIYGQRWMVGTDFPNYVRYYITDFQVREPLYRIMQNIFSELNLSFVLFTFIIFAVTLYLNYSFIISFEKNIIFILFLYLISEPFFAQMSQIRQYLAIAFFINSFRFSYKRNYLKSFVYFVLGLCFHISIIIVSPLLFIKPKLNKQTGIYLIALAAILPFLDISLILKLDLFSIYSHYLGGHFDVGLSVFHYIKFYLLLMMGLIYLFDKESETSLNNRIIFNGFLLNLLLYGLSFQFAPILRVSAYFKIFELLFLGHFLGDLKSFSKTYVKIFVSLFFVANFMGTALTDPYNMNLYQFKPLTIKETQTDSELYSELQLIKSKQ